MADRMNIELFDALKAQLAIWRLNKVGLTRELRELEKKREDLRQEINGVEREIFDMALKYKAAFMVLPELHQAGVEDWDLIETD